VVNYSFACCYPRTYTFKEITFINYSGLVRGPVCYGLMLLVSHHHVWTWDRPEDIDERHSKEFLDHLKDSVVHNAVILNVMLTTIVYGSFMSLMRDCLLAKKDAADTIENGHKVHHEDARFDKAREFQAKRCHCLKRCGGRIIEWFRSMLIRNYSPELLDAHDKESLTSTGSHVAPARDVAKILTG
jgi:hypothetical protein